MKETMKKLLGEGHWGAWGVGSRGLALVVLWALAAGGVQSVSGSNYSVLPNDRILLMNNENKDSGQVRNQGYNDTDTNADTYWVHTGPSPIALAPQKYMLAGTNHVMYTKDGTKLWELANCRAGSCTVYNNASRNYIPWDSTACSILSPFDDNIPKTTTGAQSVGSIIMRNVEDATVYSPFYEEGIGTIYFDAVNSFVNATSTRLVLEIATNLTEEAVFVGLKMDKTVEDYSLYEWKRCPFTVFTVTGSTLTELQAGVTNVTLASTTGKSGMFYRLREQLNYRGPIRFRIRRENAESGNIDAAGLVQVDNILVSFPPMSAELKQYGVNYDQELEGSDVLGCCGDFEKPFLDQSLESVRARAWFKFYRNSGSSVPSVINNARLMWRWRYLNQVVTPWQSLPFDQKVIASDSFATSNLFTQSGISLARGVGDIEYFFTAELDAPTYVPKDYAFDSSPAGYGANWSEAITTITNRASLNFPLLYNSEMQTPACGTDYFMRVREAESPYEWVRFCATVTTNGTEGTIDESARMELVTNNTWRICYYVPTNRVGETLRFHFQGKKYTTSEDDPFKYNASVSTWLCDLKEVPYLPYTSVAGTEFAHDVAIKLDDAGTHLIIEFNDELLSYSVSHGTYQNFNVWTDAIKGYKGNASYNEDAPTNGASATGVSDLKTRHEADVSDWELQGYTDPFWREDFNTRDLITYPLYKSFDTAGTPLNGWEAGHGQWIRGVRGTATGYIEEEAAFQMEGRGQGYLALDKDSNMPAGIGAVKFSARVAQDPRFDDFAIYGDGTTCENYAISACVAMSREIPKVDKSNQLADPLDMSPSMPSVSLVGYYREKKGCYEFRMTRVSREQLCCALYKWQPSASGMVAHMLASNVVTSLNNAAYAKPGPGQTSIYNFNNMLVPQVTGSRAESPLSSFTAAYIFMFNKGSESVYIRCALCTERSARRLNELSSKMTDVLLYTDSNNPLLKGSYGVGSTDCLSSFGRITIHEPSDMKDYSKGINYIGVEESVHLADGDWAYYTDRWRHMKTDWAAYGGASIGAVMPENQTVTLEFKNDLRGWFDSGYALTVSSFSTNRFEFHPNVADDYKVRLRAGGHTYDEVRTDVVLDDVEIEAWRAGDFPTLDNVGTHGQATKWVYTCGTVEAALDLEGPAMPANSVAGTNGYVYVFNKPGTYTFIPRTDILVDRAVLVGGGGGGGWAVGGGGGGGEVKELKLPTEGVLLLKGSTNMVIVGSGGSGYSYQNDVRHGGSGTASSLTLNRGAKTGTVTGSVSGGGGGGSWLEGAGYQGASGGGSAHGNATTANATAGNKGGRSNGDSPGGGGGAGEVGSPGQANGEAGKGGDGVQNDITGANVYYGGGGGGGAGNGCSTPGLGGQGGGGAGAPKNNGKQHGEDGLDGFGGGGGGGGSSPNTAGGNGGCGAVILHVSTGSKSCILQPARGVTDKPMGLRSCYLERGISMFGFNYANADPNCKLLLQVCIGTNGVYDSIIQGEASMSASLTRATPDDWRWMTVTNFTFKNKTEKERLSGTCSHFMSLREPVLGFVRLVVAPEVLQYCEDHQGPTRDVDYGRITITRIYAYDEPALDMRSWWGWNMHTEGWNTDDKEFAYLFDAPDGLSATLNFSALAADNNTARAETRGIGLMDPDLEDSYKENNSFVQCPPLTNGIGTVSFRARTFTTDQKKASVVTLWGTAEPDSYQVEVPQDWTKIAVFEITNTTYKTFQWSTTDDSIKYYSVRLSVDGSRHGRTPANPADWEKPIKVTPIERVWVDEIMASEPIAPRVVFRDVRPFRSHLADDPPPPITNVTDLSEQPLLGENWGIQATVEPQQMGDELDQSTIKVFAAFYRGNSPWGFAAWSNRASVVELERVGSGLTFRSTYNNTASIVGLDQTPNGVFPNNVWQYYVWTTYLDKSGVKHTHGIDSSEWTPPYWYYGMRDLNEDYGSGIGEKFSPYTILDSVSPMRSWVNEINICDVPGDKEDDENQFIEIAVPQGADIKDWRINVVDNNLHYGTIAQFGSGNAQITSKEGNRPGVDSTNHYTFISLRCPKALEKGKIPEADGTWKAMATDVDTNHTGQAIGLALTAGSLRYYQAYGIELVRPSGIVEHQIVVEGTNSYAGGPLEYLGSGTNLVATLKEEEGEATHWFYAGADPTKGTLGVFSSHGEDKSCWTNRMQTTASELNRLEDGTLQEIDPDWFLLPNGEYVWVYTSVIGAHISQRAGNNTNRTAVVIMRKGDSTNIVYKTDSWYQIGMVTTNNVAVPEARGRASRADVPSHQWTLFLNAVSNRIDVMVDEEPCQDVIDTGLSRTDPYYPAVMDWLTSKGSDELGVHLAEFWDLKNEKISDLDIRDMYWLDIDPTQEGWVLKAGMGGLSSASLSGTTPGGASLAACAPTPYEDELGSLTNVRVVVTMMITNQTTDTSLPYYGTAGAHAPNKIQGLEPGSSSADYGPMSGNWTSATFKVCGALQKPGVTDKYYPLRWFVFGPESFDENFQAKIEISDPHSKRSPGYYNGWNEFPLIPVWYKWKLDAEPAAYDTVEMLKADSTY